MIIFSGLIDNPMIIKNNFSIFCIFLIIALSFVIYSNSFNADFQFDDGVHLAKQEHLNDINRFSNLSTWTNINERPLSFFTLSVNYSIHGLNVFGYHLFNVLIHIISGIFVYLLSVLLFKNYKELATYIKLDEKVAALFVALIFISHPLQTQSVTYIVQRMTSLFAMFYLGSIYFYLYGRFEYSKGCAAFKSYAFYTLSFLCAIAALLSKQTAASIPLAILLVEFFFVRNLEGKLYKKYLISFSGILVILFLLLVVRGLIPKETLLISRGDYFVTQFRVLVKYVQLLIFPIYQNLDYDFSISNTLWGVREIISLLFSLFLLYLAVHLFKKHKIVSFSIFWIFVTLLIESTIIPIKDVIFEHRLYLPMFGFALIFLVLVFKFIRIKKLNNQILVMLIIIIIYSVVSHERNIVWKTRLSLWTDVVAKSPNKARAHINLGEAYFRLLQAQKALFHFNKAIELKESWLGYYNRAEVLAYLNKPDVAIIDLTRSIRLKNDFAESYDSRGLAKIHIQDFRAAVLDFDSAIKLKPSMESAWFNRANAKNFMRNFESAILDFNQAITLNPEFAEAYNNRGHLKVNIRDYKNAIDDLNIAIKIKPDFEDAYNNRAKAHMAMNNMNQAISDFSKSILLNNKNSVIFRYRAMCYYKLLDIEHAYDDFLSASNLGDTIAYKFVKSIQKETQSQTLPIKN